jgi:hypothetical protein
MSTRLSRWIVIVALICAQIGCRFNDKTSDVCFDDCAEKVLTPASCGPEFLKFEDPCLDCPEISLNEWQGPNTIEDYSKVSFQDMTLEQCIDMALQNSKIMRDLGGTVLRSPSNVVSVQDPAITYTDPRFGEEAALSQFDTNFFASGIFEKNDRVTNNQFFGNQGVLTQDLASFRHGVRKQTAVGSRLTASHTTNYDFNNQTGNRFGTPSSSWDTFVDLEMRQPLLRGFGTEFNRIAGPNQQLGFYNGVLIARSNTDISMAEFQRGVRELLSDIENAYWDLYFAYRDLDAKIVARDRALKTWRDIQASAGALNTAQNADQAREQYYRFEAEVIDALNGRLVDRTLTDSRTSGGTFRAVGGVRVAERRLRLILGTEINANQMLRPIDQPTEAAIRFDWNETVSCALANRPELRQQRWNIKQRELELVASRNYLLPQMDLIGRYRFRGFGDDLIGGGGKFTTTATNPNAFADLFSGDRTEWQLGVEMNMPVGFRNAHAAVRNSELRVARERVILHEQKRQIVYGVSNAIGDLKRAYEVRLTNYNRYLAAKSHLAGLEALVDSNSDVDLDVLLEAQRRVVDATIQYYQSQVEYNLAIKNVHFEQGTLLQFCNVDLNESAWDNDAYADASLRDILRNRPMNYICDEPIVSQGEIPVGANSGNTNFAQPIPMQMQNPAPGTITPVPSNEGNIDPSYEDNDSNAVSSSLFG